MIKTIAFFLGSSRRQVSTGAFLSANQDANVNNGLQRVLLAVPMVLVAIVLIPGFSKHHPETSTSVNTAATIETEEQEDKSIDKRVTLRLIPDQKALLGASVTTLDLAPMLNRTSLGESGEPISVEVIRSKKDVAAITVTGTILSIDWKTKTGKKREVLIRAKVPSGDYLDTRFYVELWEPDYWKLVLTVVGGLGLFLLGMKNMSDGLQAIAGNGLRKMITWVTDNRIMATGVGTLITMLVQSSSITTVTVVGFVNSGFMTLRQAIGVIMGANIGTTITGWVLVLKIGKYGLPIAGAAAFFYLFAKRDRLRFLAMTVMGLGLIFFGLELMKDGFKVLRELPDFELWFKTFAADTYFGVLKCAAVGCVLTFLVQSSSATLGITIGLAQLGVIEFNTAAALVLGENIGTTITAWLASFGASTNAKRAAYFHCIFNVLGVIWITAIFHFYLMAVRYFVTGDINDPLTLESGSATTITMAIAVTHTGFNVGNTLLFLPLTQHMARLLERMVPEKATGETKSQLSSLDIRMLESPSIAIEQARMEVIRMSKTCHKVMELAHSLDMGGNWNDELAKEIFQLEDQQDTLQVEFVHFMSNLLAANVPHDIVDEARRQIRLVDELESISDCVASAIKSKRQLHKRDLSMPEAERMEIVELRSAVQVFLQTVNKALANPDSIDFEEAFEKGEAITREAKKLSKRVLVRPPRDQLSPFVITSYSRQVASYRRVRDHLINILEVISGNK